MEPASFAIGFAGLAALFETCLRGFELFEQSKDFGRSYIVLLTRLDAQKLLFLIWGETVGLTRANGPNTLDMKEDTRVARLIQRHLECIRMIFEDADQLCSKYGVTETRPRGLRDRVSGSALMPFKKSQLPLRRYVRWFQKQSSYKLKAKWVIQDQSKFKIMLDDLSALLQQLREITSAIADIERQRDCFVEKINSCTGIEDLEIIEEALSEEDPAFSNAASERRMALTEAAITIQDDELRHHDDDDMVTHADSDPAAQALVDLNKLPPTHGELQEYQLEKTFSGVTATGHLNNLAMIQQKHRAQFSDLSNDETWNIHFDSGTLKPHAAQVLRKRLLRFQRDASMSCFISLGLENDRLDRLIGIIQGPSSTPYEGGVFRVAIRIPEKYPWAVLKCRFLTPIHHPNIDSSGNICLEILEDRQFNFACSLPEYVLMSICSLLTNPQYENAIVPEIAKQWKHDRYNFEIQARLKTQRFAMPHASAAAAAIAGAVAGAAAATQSDKVSQAVPANARSQTPAEQTFRKLLWRIYAMFRFWVLAILLRVFPSRDSSRDSPRDHRHLEWIWARVPVPVPVPVGNKRAQINIWQSTNDVVDVDKKTQ